MTEYIVTSDQNPLFGSFSYTLQCPMWNEKEKSAHDMFAEYNPKNIICSSKLSPQFVSAALKYKPNIYLYLHSFSEELNVTTQQDVELVQKIQPLVVKTFTHYTPSFKRLINGWNSNALSLPVAAVELPKHIPFGAPAYCGYFIPNESWYWVINYASKNKFHIFGNWPCEESVGRCTEKLFCRVLAGTTLSLVPDHEVKSGVGLQEEVFNSIYCGGYCLVRDTLAAREIFEDKVEYYNCEEDLQKLKKKKKYKFDISKHTYKERLKDLLL